MPSKSLPRPTDAELEILNVLWRRGPSTVREVHDVLLETKDIGYTTILKLMQIMAEKGLVSRDESDRSHVYEAERAEDETQRQLLSDLLDRAFQGSATKLVMQALSSKKASREELAEIRSMLDELERGKKR
ncbi:MAG: BlaI/MecI/CopY family transcriptional regulator [Acidobacteria bacterium]|nr:BlaI/MecI/CopY family transcriptional regulator [Acidobacteriota bacterium]